MIDRFHDDQARAPVLQVGRSNGISTPDDFFGGTLKGVTTNLDYIADSAARPSGSRRSSRTMRRRITATTSATIQASIRVSARSRTSST